MDLLNLRDDMRLNFAFSVRSIYDKETLLDPRYVKMLTKIFWKNADGSKGNKIIGQHACTDDDWAKFAPPSKTA